MLIDAGPRDRRAVQGLKDYGLIYRGEALPEDLMIAGEVRVILSVQSDCPDTDFVARRTSATRNRWFARLTAEGKGFEPSVRARLVTVLSLRSTGTRSLRLRAVGTAAKLRGGFVRA